MEINFSSGNINYDSLHNTVNELKFQLVKEAESQKTFLKSKEVSSLEQSTKDFEIFGSEQEKTKQLANNLMDQFILLKSDFNNGKINLVTFRRYLNPLHDLLINAEEKIYIPGFNIGTIASTLKWAGFN